MKNRRGEKAQIVKSKREASEGELESDMDIPSLIRNRREMTWNFLTLFPGRSNVAYMQAKG